MSSHGCSDFQIEWSMYIGRRVVLRQEREHGESDVGLFSKLILKLNGNEEVF